MTVQWQPAPSDFVYLQLASGSTVQDCYAAPGTSSFVVPAAVASSTAGGTLRVGHGRQSVFKLPNETFGLIVAVNYDKKG